MVPLTQLLVHIFNLVDVGAALKNVVVELVPEDQGRELAGGKLCDGGEVEAPVGAVEGAGCEGDEGASEEGGECYAG